MRKASSCCCLLTGVVVVAGFTVGCAAEVGGEADVDITTATLTAGRSYLVSFAGGGIPANASSLIAGAGGTIVARYKAVGAVLARSTRPSFASSLRATAGIDAVGAADTVKSSIAPVTMTGKHHPPHTVPPAAGDPLSPQQWNMDQIRAPQARSISAGKKSVIAGLFDSGVDVTHADLAGQVNASASGSCLGGIANPSQAIWADDVIGHGTFTSSVVAAAKNNVGIVGVAPNVTLAMVKVAIDDFNDPNFGQVFADSFVCAVDWAIAHNWDLINASLTIDPFTAPDDDTFCSDQPDRAAVVKIVRRAVLEAARNKVTMVAATGNAFTDLANLDEIIGGTNCKQLPIQSPRVIGVSAVGVTRQLSFYSNYGFRATDLTAPGGDGLIPNPADTSTTASGQVLGAVPPGSLYYQLAADWDGQVQDCTLGTCQTYAFLQGTSAAAPHVTGVGALLVSRFGKQTPEQLLVKMSLGATPLACPPSPYDPGGTGQPATCRGPAFYNNFYGAGEVDALAAVR
jgi:lantibiotic leader peptide-processing serine protease